MIQVIGQTTVEKIIHSEDRIFICHKDGKVDYCDMNVDIPKIKSVIKE